MTTLTLLCGMPGAGKSTYASRVPNAVVLTADAMRLRPDVAPRRLFAELFARARKRLTEGHNVVIDVCALRREDREPWLRVARDVGADTHLVLIDTPYATCRERDAKRPAAEQAKVDWNAMYTRWSQTKRAHYAEGWGRTSIVSGGTNV